MSTATTPRTKLTTNMKRADKRESITVLTLGDDGVGKSSLISTFVFRHFAETVPGIMARVSLPPDHHQTTASTCCVTTIVDSQNGDLALEQAIGGAASKDASKSPIQQVDSIVLAYDLSRDEITFSRLENHWLPLIEQYYGGKVPVIVAECKLDLFIGSDQALARKRQQIVGLMQRFPFVRQCIKCSARQGLRVEDVFLKAQQAVLYPFVPPLYDLTTGQLTVECKRAFTRIFRLFDRDRDGLLSDLEVERFQRETYQAIVFDRDLATFKKHVSRNNTSTESAVLRDGKFTVHGFLTTIDVFISQNRLDVVWQALRKYNYDDDLNLHVPDSVTNPEFVRPSANWKLSRSAKKFLAQMFHHFDSNKDGFLSPDDIVSMFSILPPPCLPPWHPMRAPELFEGCFSMPKESPACSSSSGSDTPELDSSLIIPAAMSQSILSTSGVSLLSAGDSLPSVDLGGMHPLSKSLSYLDWMGHWHTLSVISPSVTREELYRLGHAEEYGRTEANRLRAARKAKRNKVASTPATTEETLPPDAGLKSRELRVLVLGSRSCGKTALLNALCGTFDASVENNPTALQTVPTARPETSASYVKLKRNSKPAAADNLDDDEEFVVHLVFTDVPEAAAAKQEEHIRELSELFGSSSSPRDRLCDLAMLVFDCANEASFLYVKDLEFSLLSRDTPRVFVAAKYDTSESRCAASATVPTTVLELAKEHCMDSELEAPLVTSVKEDGLELGVANRQEVLVHLAQCALHNETGVDNLKSIPHEERKRREAVRRRNLLWISGIVGVAVAVGVGLLLGASGKKDQKASPFGWLRSFFGNPSRVKKN